MLDMCSERSSEETFMQSEENEYMGSPLPGFRAAVAFFNSSIVTLLTLTF
jgi:hypothetical protein